MITVKIERSFNGPADQYEIKGDGFPSALLRPVAGGWKRWAGGHTFPTLVECIDQLVSQYSIEEYVTDATVLIADGHLEGEMG